MRRGAALLALFAGLAVLHTWPLATDPARLSRLDNGDTALNTWIVAWVADAVARDPLHLFHAPIFYPEPYTLAYSEHMLAPSLLGAPLLWAGASPVLVYNLLVLTGFALSGWAMCLVVARWTGSTAAGVVSGMLFAFNAQQLVRLPHLQALHVEFVPVVLFAFDRLLSAGRDEADAAATRVRDTVLLASAFVVQALCSNYTLVFVSGALVMAAAVRAPEWLAPGRRARAAALLCAGAAAVVLLAPFLWPYYAVSRDQGLTRSLDEVRLYSAGLLDYLTTAGRLHYEWWSHRFYEGRTSLFPGITAMALSAAALSAPGAWRDARVRMIAAIGAAGVLLSFGPGLPGYAWLHDTVPLLEGIRAAARWGFLLLTAVAVLAGYGVARIERRWRGSAHLPALIVAIAGAVTIEALRAPMGFVPFHGIPPIYDRLRTEPDAVVVEIPLFHGVRVGGNARYLVPNTRAFRPLVNGYSGFEPAAFRARAERWRAFPSEAVLDEMAAIGVTHVMVHTGEVDEDTAQAVRAAARLVVVEGDGERVLYRLTGPA